MQNRLVLSMFVFHHLHSKLFVLGVIEVDGLMHTKYFILILLPSRIV